MVDAVTPGRPNSKLSCSKWARILFDKLRQRVIRPRTPVWLATYMEDCGGKLMLPQTNDVLRALFPKARSGV